ncbi:hypothetical protein SK128_004565, partial [Halocaridina rubra]
ANSSSSSSTCSRSNNTTSSVSYCTSGDDVIPSFIRTQDFKPGPTSSHRNFPLPPAPHPPPPRWCSCPLTQ